MAKRYIETDNSRGKTVTAANPTYAHIRGWNAGVKVEAIGSDGNTWAVYMTAGSSGDTTTTTPIGMVTATPDGPVFEPANLPLPLKLKDIAI